LALFGLGGAAILNICANMLVANIYDQKIAGEYFTTNAMCVLGGIFALFGVSDLLIRENAGVDNIEGFKLPRPLITQVLYMSVLASFVSIVAIWIIVPNPWLLFLGTIPILFASLQVNIAKWRIQNKFMLVGISLLVLAAIRLGCVGSAYMFKWNLSELCVATGGSVFVVGAFVWWFTLRTSSKDDHSVVLKKGMTYFFSSIVGNSRGQFDIILVNLLLGGQVAALYVPASVLPKRSVLLAFGIADTTLLHKTLGIAKKSISSFKKQVWMITGLLVLLGAIVSLLGAVISKQFLALYGEEYLKAQSYFILFLVIIPIRYGLASLTSALKHEGTSSGRLKDQCVALVTMVSLLVVGSLYWEMTGAIVAVIIADLFLLLLFVRRLYCLKP